jgi:hypothetical protein
MTVPLEEWGVRLPSPRYGWRFNQAVHERDPVQLDCVRTVRELPDTMGHYRSLSG